LLQKGRDQQEDVKVFWANELLTDRVIILIITTLVAQMLHVA